MQAIMLVGNLACIRLFQRAVVSLAAPFESQSAGISGWHKFYNRIVMFPASDPLRSRKPRHDADQAPRRLPAWLTEPSLAVLGSLAALFAVAGAVSLWRLASQSNGYPISRLIMQPHIPTVQIDLLLAQSALPDELHGMQQISYDLLPAPGSAAAQGGLGRWTFARGQQTLQLTLVAPARGFFPRERQWLLDGSSLLEPRTAQDQSASTAVNGLLLDELTLQDPVVGPSYLTYATWSTQTTLRRDMATDMQGTWKNWYQGLAYQPTTLSLSLYAVGNVPETPEQRQEYQQILIDAVKQLQLRLAGTAP
jgi:hypothetical protein